MTLGTEPHLYDNLYTRKDIFYVMCISYKCISMQTRAQCCVNIYLSSLLKLLIEHTLPYLRCM